MAGLPGIDDFASYGGALANYAAVEDPTTDEDASWRNLYAANVAAMTQTIARAWCAFEGHGTTPVDPASNIHGAVWGDSLGVKPVVERTGTGVYTITWPETVSDELNEEHTVNLRRCWASVSGSSLYFHTETVTAPNEVTLRVFNTSFAANDGVGVTFTVYAI